MSSAHISLRWKKFKFVANRLSAPTTDNASTSGIGNCIESVHGQLIRYIEEVEQSAADDALS